MNVGNEEKFSLLLTARLLICVSGYWSEWKDAYTDCDENCYICQERSCLGVNCVGSSTRMAWCHRRVECRTKYPENLVLSDGSSQSSTDKGATSSRAVDGTWDGNWASHSCSQTKGNEIGKPWFRVRTSKRLVIRYVMILNRLDAEDGLKNFVIQVLNDDSVIGACTTYNSTSSTMGNIPALFTCDTQLKGNGVKIRLNTRGILTICEIAVYTDDPGCVEPQLFGYDYTGPVQRTLSGQTCVRWSSPRNSIRNIFNLDHNMCRNFAGSGHTRPFCVVEEGSREDCLVGVCQNRNARIKFSSQWLGGILGMFGGKLLWIIVAVSSLIILSPILYCLWKRCHRKKSPSDDANRNLDQWNELDSSLFPK